MDAKIMDTNFRSISAGDGAIDIYSDKKIAEYFDKLAPLFLPDNFFSDKDRQEEIYNIYCFEGPKKFEYDQKNFLIQGDYSTRQLALDAIMLTSYLGEILAIKDTSCSFHSSAVSDGENIILIAGPAGSGKTTTLVKACEEGLNLYSTGRTIIKDDLAIGGTKYLLMREGTLNYDFKKSCDGIVVNPESGPWDRIVGVSPESVDFPVDEGEKKIKDIVLLRRGNHGLKKYTLKKDTALLRLYENLLHFVDVYPNMILGQKEPMPRFLQGSYRKEILKYAKYLAEEISLTVLAGNMDEISNEIVKMIKYE